MMSRRGYNPFLGGLLGGMMEVAWEEVVEADGQAAAVADLAEAVGSEVLVAEAAVAAEQVEAGNNNINSKYYIFNIKKRMHPIRFFVL